MRILALPRDANPYQESLYREMRARGAEVRYAGELTPSRTLNVLLLPGELLARRLAGWRVLHVHWVWGFALPGAGRRPVMRRIARAWATGCLRLARLLGQRIVWTAHNVLPHQQVFDDDVAARRSLVGLADLVIAHNRSTVEQLGALGIHPRRVARIPLGPSRRCRHTPVAATASDGVTHLAFVGRIQPYKGVADLLSALQEVPTSKRLSVQVMGACPDAGHRAEIERLAAASPHPVRLVLEHVSDERLEAAVLGADAVVLPFRRVTTSSSAVLALDLGRPLIVPSLSGLEELPEGAVIRYDGSVRDLTAVIGAFADMDLASRTALRNAAAAHTAPPWSSIAATTMAEIAALGEGAPRDPRPVGTDATA